MLEVLTDSTSKKATSVTYVDSSGDMWEQPADLVIVAAFTFENVRLMLSKIGEAYDPVTNKGTTGRNYAYQTANNVTLFFDGKNFNPFIGAGAVGMGIDEFNNDNFDHRGLGCMAQCRLPPTPKCPSRTWRAR